MENIEKDTQSEDYDRREQYIVIARVETEYENCQVVREDAVYPAIYSQVFGPASRSDCEAWMAKHCTGGSQSREKQVYEVKDAQIAINKRLPPEVSIIAEGVVRTLGWTNGRLEPYVYVQPPPDGIYDFDFVATPPSSPAGDALSPITSKEYKMPMPENFRGVRIHAETNKMEFFPIRRLDEK
ncbi:MAG: hypothetical protein WA584_18720 [Pyrinomonadaceae bacterium]